MELFLPSYESCSCKAYNANPKDEYGRGFRDGFSGINFKQIILNVVFTYDKITILQEKTSAGIVRVTGSFVQSPVTIRGINSNEEHFAYLDRHGIIKHKVHRAINRCGETLSFKFDRLLVQKTVQNSVAFHRYLTVNTSAHIANGELKTIYSLSSRIKNSFRTFSIYNVAL